MEVLTAIITINIFWVLPKLKTNKKKKITIALHFQYKLGIKKIQMNCKTKIKKTKQNNNNKKNVNVMLGMFLYRARKNSPHPKNSILFTHTYMKLLQRLFTITFMLFINIKELYLQVERCFLPVCASTSNPTSHIRKEHFCVQNLLHQQLLAWVCGI